jgi:hypothetical protein
MLGKQAPVQGSGEGWWRGEQGRGWEWGPSTVRLRWGHRADGAGWVHPRTCEQHPGAQGAAPSFWGGLPPWNQCQGQDWAAVATQVRKRK